MVLPHIFGFLICIFVIVSLICCGMWLSHLDTMLVFCCFVIVFTSVRAIQTTKHIQSDRDDKSNYGHLYVVKLES